MTLTLHVGLPKAGSSFLQQKIFPDVDNLRYEALRRKGGDHAEDSRFGQFVRFCRQGNALHLPPNHFDDLLAPTDRPARLVSEERFSAHTALSLTEKPRVLKEVFGPANILLVVRSPAPFFASLFFQELRYDRYGTAQPKSFTRWANAAIDRADHFLSPAQLLRVDRIVNRFDEIFGAERVHVLPMEWIQANAEAFAEKLVDILGTGDATAIASRCKASAVNARPRTVSSILMGRGVKSRSLMARAAMLTGLSPDKDALRRIVDYARPGTEYLAERYDLPLTDLGYETAEA